MQTSCHFTIQLALQRVLDPRPRAARSRTSFGWAAKYCVLGPLAFGPVLLLFAISRGLAALLFYFCWMRQLSWLGLVGT
jgi:hypothetical protein